MTTSTNEREPVRLLNPITGEYVTLEVVTLAPWTRKGNEICIFEAHGALATPLDRNIHSFLEGVQSHAGRKYQHAEDDSCKHTRDDRLSLWEYVTVRMKIKEIIERPTTDTFDPAATIEGRLKVKNAHGRQVNLSNAWRYAHVDITSILCHLLMHKVATGEPTGLFVSPQEWFDRHNEIYQVAYNRKFKFVK